MKDGSKIDVDDMSLNHLRNALKMLIRKKQNNKILRCCNMEPYAFDYMYK